METKTEMKTETDMHSIGEGDSEAGQDKFKDKDKVSNGRRPKLSL